MILPFLSIAQSGNRNCAVFISEDIGKDTIMGYVPVYNHSCLFNCGYETAFANERISIKTVRRVNPGDELFINYNDDWNDSDPL